jgi:hypothetical protein
MQKTFLFAVGGLALVAIAIVVVVIIRSSLRARRNKALKSFTASSAIKTSNKPIKVRFQLAKF